VVVGDGTDPGLAERTVAKAESKLGPVDMLVTNAGLLGQGAVGKIDPDLWERSAARQ